jgi:Skp family chaperone for outer membrane proteins
MSRLILRVLFAVFWMPLLGVAQTPAQAPAAPASAAPSPAKLAWMNLEQAIFSCEEGKKEFAEVQRFVDAKNSELENLRKEAESLRNQLNVQGSKLTDEARLDLESQVDAKETSLQRFQQDTQKEIDSRRMRTTNYLGKRLLPVIEKVAREKGLTAVLYFNSSRDAWVDPATNITEEIVKAYNQTYPVSAPKAPASAPASKP